MPFVKERLTELKSRLGCISYKQLADEIDVPYGSLQHWLYRGIEPTIDSLDRLYTAAAKHGIFDLKFYEPPVRKK